MVFMQMQAPMRTRLHMFRRQSLTVAILAQGTHWAVAILQAFSFGPAPTIRFRIFFAAETRTVRRPTLPALLSVQDASLHSW